jgi:hypothetical protein
MFPTQESNVSSQVLEYSKWTLKQNFEILEWPRQELLHTICKKILVVFT